MALGYTTPIHGTVLAGTVSGTLLAARTNRRYCNIINDSDTAVYIRLGTTAAVANYGIRVNANGGNYEMTMDRGNLWTGAITCICSAASKTMLLTEGT